MGVLENPGCRCLARSLGSCNLVNQKLCCYSDSACISPCGPSPSPFLSIKCRLENPGPDILQLKAGSQSLHGCTGANRMAISLQRTPAKERTGSRSKDRYTKTFSADVPPESWDTSMSNNTGVVESWRDEDGLTQHFKLNIQGTILNDLE